MSINTKSNLPDPGTSLISKRKQDHIDVCRREAPHKIESEISSGFESLKFIHTALPELFLNEISTEIEFLESRIRLPLFISCMTGGTEEGYRANKELAIAAGIMNVPFGLGSMRVLLEHPDRIRDFSFRKYAEDAPIIGNIGAVQLRESSLYPLKDLCERLELNALTIHLNCGQELFQKGGDRDFRGLKTAIKSAIDELKIPMIVKETGFGINPSLINELIEMGAYYVDIAGAGGTNWILVEGAAQGRMDAAAAEFAEWGITTAHLLDASRKFQGKILASGGIRCGMDLAKAIALGAVAGGMALPFIRAALEGGHAAVCKMIEHFEQVLRSVMLLTGCKTTLQLREAPLLKTMAFEKVSSVLTSLG